MHASNVSCTDSEPTSKARGNTLLVLLLCNVSYHVNHIGIHIVSWKNVVAGLQKGPLT